MTTEQERTVYLLYVLGSDPVVTRISGRNVYVGVPFRPDRNPGVEVFPDGGYYDYTADPRWRDYGLEYWGNADRLEQAISHRMSDEWEGQSAVDSPEVSKYKSERKLVGDIRSGVWNGREYIAFKMVDPTNINKIVGIQRRFIDGDKPKNMMVRGSGGNGIFIRQDLSNESGNVFIMEGATDTASDNGLYGTVIGAPSASMLKGVIEYVNAPHFIPISKVYLCFDKDDAGRAATSKLLATFKKDYNVYVLQHPEGTKDVNDIVVKGLSFEFVKCDDELNGNISFMDFHDEPIFATGYREGIPADFAPNMQEYVPDHEPPDTVYVAESVGKQEIYKQAKDNPLFQFIIVRGL